MGLFMLFPVPVGWLLVCWFELEGGIVLPGGLLLSTIAWMGRLMSLRLFLKVSPREIRVQTKRSCEKSLQLMNMWKRETRFEKHRRDSTDSSSSSILFKRQTTVK